MNSTQVIDEKQMIDIARKVARAKSQKWQDVDDIEGYIILQLHKRQPKEPHHAVRIARSAKIDWIRKEIGPKGQKKNIRNVYDLNEASSITTEEERDANVTILTGMTSLERRIVAGLGAGMTYQQIADVVGVTRVRISQRVKVIRKKVRENMENADD